MIYPYHSNDITETFPIQLQLFSADYHQPPVTRPEGVPYWQWFYCVNGQGELIINRQRFLINPGHGFLIWSNEPHSYREITPDWTLHIFGFGGSLCPELLRALHMSESGAYQFSDSQLFLSHIEKLLYLYKNRSQETTAVFSKECYDFLLDISLCITFSRSSMGADENELTATLTAYLERHYFEPVSLQELADIVNLSRDYMCALFKQYTGKTIIQYLTEIRIGHARHFLTQHPEKRVLEIGQMCGFESPSYFGKIFKREVGMSPEKYRMIR